MADNIYVSEENIRFIRDTEETIKNHIKNIQDTDGGVYVSTDSGKLWVGKKRIGVNFEKGSSTNSIQQEGTSANAENSFTVGEGTTATNKNQTVVGQYNAQDDDALFIVGVGADKSSLKNAITVSEDLILLNQETQVSSKLTIGNEDTAEGILQVNGTATINNLEVKETTKSNVVEVTTLSSNPETNLIDIDSSFKRTTSKPLDTTCVFDSYQAALDYIHAKDTTAYEGQVLTVKGITYIVSYDEAERLRLKDIAYNAYYDVFETLGNEENVRFICPRGEVYVYFVDNKISQLILPDTVEEISKMDNLGLKTIKFPNSLKRIAELKELPNLTSITIPDSVTFLEGIKNCPNLTFISIGERVNDVGTAVFRGCESLTPDSVIIDSNNKHLTIKGGCIIKDNNTIIGGTNKYTIPTDENITLIRELALSYSYPSEGDGTIVIPENIKTIDDLAFYHTEGTTVYIRGAETLGERAFANSEKIGYVELSDSVKTIGDYAFEYCTNLASVTLGNGVETIGKYAFASCDNLTSISIPDSVKTIGGYAFSECINLASVTLGNSVETLGGYAFYECTNIASVTLGNGVETIGERVFWGCSNLTSVTIGNGVKSIGEGAFYDCSKLSSITIPNSVTSIGASAFDGTGIDSMIMSNNIEYIADNALPDILIHSSYDTTGGVLWDNSRKIPLVLINAEGLGSTPPWSTFRVIYADSCSYGNNQEAGVGLVFNENLYQIGARAFKGNPNISYLNMTDATNLKHIGEEAFDDCNDMYLDNLTIPDSVEYIGRGAFRNCPISSISIPFVGGGSATETGNSRFQFIFQDRYWESAVPKRLKKVIVRGGTSIANLAFFECSTIENIELPDGLKTIGTTSFARCYALKSINIPKSVESIGDNAFTIGWANDIIINYDGTRAAWQELVSNITLSYSDYRVICSDSNTVSGRYIINNTDGDAFIALHNALRIYDGNHDLRLSFTIDGDGFDFFGLWITYDTLLGIDVDNIPCYTIVDDSGNTPLTAESHIIDFGEREQPVPDAFMEWLEEYGTKNQ